MSGSQDALAKLRATVSTAVSRGQQAAAKAREHGERFRSDNRALAEKVDRRAATPKRDELTSQELLAQTAAFREGAGLSVPTHPSGEELLADAQKVEEADRAKPVPFRKAHSPAGLTTYGDDEDDDFSQERILG
ncbi:hypothetical protein [Actinoalloteichus hymeniacidonis]|uniref:Uncharacterized protein n=1 Tax=Actinoalloteichus hymeniacidonis TaxID=340345 RepID=A0AAC9HVH9_9PSEU|nr:hypothetical protein [Actinoalloteichus hymeniacidonis]AOS65766.1 hypothetical protein TL08_24940 [Actinoalloteichus hymeniacidonis]MBB5906144.1 hypothetical protein [Actinoalloteichus hymeniacidonis]